MKINQVIDKLTKTYRTRYEIPLKGKKSKMNLTSLGKVLFAAILSLVVLTGVLLVHYESEQYKQQELERVQLILDDMRGSLTSRIYSNIYKVSSVKVLVAMNPDLTQDDFARAMEVQFRGEHDLRNIGLARDMTLQFMYPIEGNEAAIGLDYTTLPDQFEAVDLALRLNEIVLAGPLTLVQGGEGIIARIPIYITDTETYKEEFWGFASVVMNSEAIIAGAGIKEDHDALRIAIRGRDALGAKGDVFWGDPLVFENDPVTHLIELPYGSWQIGAIPSAGWSSYSVFSTPLMGFYLIVSIAVIAFTGLIVFLLAELKKAMEALEKERNIFAEGPVFTMEWDPKPYDNWPLRNFSTNVDEILGYSSAEMLHIEFSYCQLIHPDEREGIINEVKYNIENQIDSFEQSYRLKTKTGQYIWVYDFTRLVRNEEGNLMSIRSYMYDQSAQKKSEEALRIAETKLEKTAYELTENIPVGTYTMVQPAHGGMASFVFMSRRFLELTGLTREEAAADPMKVYACVHPDDFDEWMALNIRTFEEKSSFLGETRVVAKGEVRWITAEYTPRTLPDGRTVWEGVLVDITDRKRAEEEIKTSRKKIEEAHCQLEAEINKAAEIHKKVLPEKIPSTADFSIAAHFQPAIRMGGDSYNVIKSDNKLIIYVSDVMGHSLDGAMISFFLKESISSYITLKPEDITPRAILQHLYRQYEKERYPDEQLLCIFMGVLDLETRELVYASAGFQTQPLVRTSDGEQKKLHCRGIFISNAMPAEMFDPEEFRIYLMPRTVVLISSDGLFEQVNSEGKWFSAYCKDVFYKNSHLPPEDIVQAINKEFCRFNNKSPIGDDDITYLVLQAK